MIIMTCPYRCTGLKNQRYATITKGVYQWQIQDFPFGRGGADPLGGGADLRHVCFSVKTCENERIGSCWGTPPAPPGSANAYATVKYNPRWNDEVAVPSSENNC